MFGRNALTSLTLLFKDNLFGTIYAANSAIETNGKHLIKPEKPPASCFQFRRTAAGKIAFKNPKKLSLTIEIQKELCSDLNSFLENESY